MTVLHVKIKTGDTVQMLGGKDRGKTGKVLRVSKGDGKAVVEGLNTVKRHLRARKQGQKGQIIARERWVSLSNMAVMCKACGKATRVGYQLGQAGADKIRICKRCKAQL
ncbi:MAG: 50S ribosomal protein L24 [Candidatus Yanofskybacteria bacterium]|nr:50S ribosomal protein L24 [Candidatus Yanofskybacteria bacterium]